ncbi:class I SAM-dependent methyltransferase [Barrientosiimonas endolithica]|uniref:Class I SAM-dependent methyltransferase n=1 Tax=Barrientosiimonas endolithica TaxID=1535208 RepID=A0ABM8HB88_9MICO|nr:class I SAM-dependent methyltransferase [Barrientosiimonas endolithica]BDZ58208.1 hypothetical protein GCM10025872_18650 [Barrientosiimonas endolithica]
MDTTAFFAALPTVFDGDPQDHDPRDPYWRQHTERVDGFTSPNELAVLNLAARLLPANEAYLEVGTFKGRSLSGVVRGITSRRFYAMENFGEFGMSGVRAREELMRNLATYAGEADVELIEGDCFALLAKPGLIDRPVGVYFYDGEHTLLAHYLALAVAEPVLADEALVLVDDASWPMVQRAHRLFLQRHPGWEVAATWDAPVNDDPRWANGLHALVFRRVRPSRLSARDEALRRYQTTVQDRLNAVAWAVGSRLPDAVKTRVQQAISGARTIRGGND